MSKYRIPSDLNSHNDNNDFNEKIKSTLKRDKDFCNALERFLAEYRMDRIADVNDFLEGDTEYKKLHSKKIEKERTLQTSISHTKFDGILLDYINSMDYLIDEVKAIFYEHGFQDCITIAKVMQRGLSFSFMHTLLELDKE